MELLRYMHGGTLPRWLQSKGIGENIRRKVDVASRKKTIRLSPIAL